VQAGASTELPALTANEVPTTVQAGIGTELILEEAAGSSFKFPVSTAEMRYQLLCKQATVPNFV
jgi:hypothetical protein